MQASSAPYLHQGETIQAVFGAQTASQWLAALTGIFVFLGLNRYRIFVVTPQRILILDATIDRCHGAFADEAGDPEPPPEGATDERRVRAHAGEL